MRPAPPHRRIAYRSGPRFSTTHKFVVQSSLTPPSLFDNAPLLALETAMSALLAAPTVAQLAAGRHVHRGSLLHLPAAPASCSRQGRQALSSHRNHCHIGASCRAASVEVVTAPAEVSTDVDDAATSAFDSDSPALPHWMSRTTLLLEAEGIEALRKTRVLIVGLGGVGGFAAEFLARCGQSKPAPAARFAAAACLACLPRRHEAASRSSA